MEYIIMIAKASLLLASLIIGSAFSCLVALICAVFLIKIAQKISNVRLK